MLLFDFYQRGYSQNLSLAILKELHRPALLMLRHRPESRRDLPTCGPMARTDHEPPARPMHLSSNYVILYMEQCTKHISGWFERWGVLWFDRKIYSC